MTKKANNTIFINRLIVLKDDESIYDEKFSRGINIIRGENSSGKSTIADFIFFVLGGDFIKWTEEAAKCTHAVAEIELNEKILTISRNVTEKALQSMSIYYGDIEKALKSRFKGWEEYQFARSNKESFSQVFFQALGYPEAKSDIDESITMHQLLRVLYIDQLTNVESLMRDEQFDTPAKRSAIGDFLLGIFEDELLKKEFELKQVKNEFSTINSKYNSLKEVLELTDKETNIKKISLNIEKIESKLDEINNAISEKKEKLVAKKTINIPKFKDKKKELQTLKDNLNDRTKDMHSIMLEINDSKDFIENLKEKVSSLDNSITTRYALGELKLLNCPHCLAPIKEPNNDDSCILCHTPISKNPKNSPILKMKQELNLQIKESESILQKKIANHKKTKNSLPKIEAEIKILEKDLFMATKAITNKKDKILENLLVEKGKTENEILQLNEDIKANYSLEDLKTLKGETKANIEILNTEINTLKANKQNDLKNTTKLIQKHTICFLESDLDREDFFKSVEVVDLDFAKNCFSIDGRNQFSASSKVYLKNSIHFGLFFSSLELDSMRYPRFILCDNIEDKGMEEVRSQNFQEILVEKSKKSKVEHQIIITTSMISPNLDNTKHCVGEKYTHENKSLHFN